MHKVSKYKGYRPIDRVLIYYLTKFPNHPIKLRLINLINDIIFKGQVKVVGNNQAIFRLSTREQIGYGILVTGNYEPLTINLAAEILKNGGTFVDVGANIGLFSITLGKLSGVKIFAIEPDIKNFSKLLQHISDNNSTNIIPINVAVSQNESFAYMHNSSPANSGAMSVINQNLPGSYLTKLCTLSGIVEYLKITAIDLLKIDIEGHEFSALKGLFNYSAVKPQNIILENNTNPGMFEFLTGLGYRPYDVSGNSYTGSHLPEANLLFKLQP